jgi:hydrogenase maturation protein HypF
MQGVAGIGSPESTGRPSVLDGVAAVRLRLLGRVQGVGFRPFVVRLASDLELAGWVRNTLEGAVVHLEGQADRLAAFRDRVVRTSPPAAEIHAVEAEEQPAQGCVGFSIRPSERIGDAAGGGGMAQVRAVIAPDLATCPACLAEFETPGDRRFGYALLGCTACGPRFSFQASAPFDRERTTMVDFAPCPECLREYADPADRRYHAQNIACPRCGPRIRLEISGDSVAMPHSGSSIPNSTDLPVLEQAARLLRDGKIVAVKGVGGFHLLCDATSPHAVARLRERKRRDRKPLAVLFLDATQVSAHAEVEEAAREALLGPDAPILLLRRRDGSTLAPEIAPGLSTVGAFLAYTPLHRALVRMVDRPLVATSANATDEPMPIDNGAARAELGRIADAFVLHDRRILRHADDSVVRIIGGRSVPLRIGRGLAPVRIELPVELPALLATGGHLKAAIALTRGRELFLGQHVGDLDTPGARRRYVENVADLARLLGVEPALVIHDGHPDYFTTRYAQERGLPCLAVQHHHAHIMACLAEHGEAGPALGIAWDGTGLGHDGTIWGGEFLVVDGPHYRRIGSLWPFPLVGGDRAAREPRLSAAGVCFAAGETIPDDLGFSDAERSLLLSAFSSPRAAIVTTSAGRLFDAWASLLGIAHHSAFEAEAAMRLEDLADPSDQGAFDVAIAEHPGAGGAALHRLDWRPWVAETKRRLEEGHSLAKLAACFHNSLAVGSLQIARRVGLETIVLGGGCFQNRLLVERVADLLVRAGFRVLTHRRVPPGDGGLAVGQTWAAALRLASG